MSAIKQLKLVHEFVCRSCLLRRLGGIIDAEVDASLRNQAGDPFFVTEGCQVSPTYV